MRPALSRKRNRNDRVAPSNHFLCGRGRDRVGWIGGCNLSDGPISDRRNSGLRRIPGLFQSAGKRLCPIAAFGVLAYFSVFSFATFAAFGYPRSGKFFALTVWAMFAVTLWLLFVQAFVLHAFCRYCLLSAALIFILAAVVVLTPSSR